MNATQATILHMADEAETALVDFWCECDEEGRKLLYQHINGMQDSHDKINQVAGMIGMKAITIMCAGEIRRGLE
jgi:hypothetical protein